MHRRTLLTAATALPLLASAHPGAMREDFEILSATLRALHPGLHRYLRPAAFSAALHRASQAWAAAEDDATRLRTLNSLLARLRCGHSYPNFWNQRAQIKEQLILGAPRLPLHFVFLQDGSACVLRSTAEAGIAPGSRLLAIDGTPLAQLREQLLPQVRADGHNRHGGLALLAPSGSDDIETWDVLHPLYTGARAAFTVRVATPQGRVIERRLRGLSHRERLAMRAGPDLTAAGDFSDAAPPWPPQIRDDGQAVLTMGGWAMYRTRWDWQAYLARCFERLQQAAARHLVIDLRGNEGGLACGDEILARLIDAPLDARLTERRVRYRRVPAELSPYLDTWDDGFRDWGDAVEPAQEAGWYRFRSSPLDRISPKGPRFAGRVSVLIDGHNHSATFRFISLLRRHRLGRLVGGPSGGNQRGLNGGGFFFLRLPASGIEVDVPLIGSFAPAGTPDAGWLPDLAMENRAADIAVGRDAVLAAALS